MTQKTQQAEWHYRLAPEVVMTREPGNLERAGFLVVRTLHRTLLQELRRRLFGLVRQAASRRSSYGVVWQDQGWYDLPAVAVFCYVRLRSLRRTQRPQQITVTKKIQGW
jgi:hypothetical protein